MYSERNTLLNTDSLGITKIDPKYLSEITQCSSAGVVTTANNLEEKVRCLSDEASAAFTNVTHLKNFEKRMYLAAWYGGWFSDNFVKWITLPHAK